jgi:hypothetical protein
VKTRSPAVDSSDTDIESNAPHDWLYSQRGGLLWMAILTVACWTAVALLAAATVHYATQPMTAFLVAAAVVVGAIIGFLPALIYRREAAYANEALSAIVTEAPVQLLIETRTRYPTLFSRVRFAGESTKEPRLRSHA